MILVLKENNISATYRENDIALEKLIELYSGNEFNILSVPDEDLGTIENLLPDKTLDDLDEKILSKINHQTASLNRKIEETNGVSINGIKFRTDTKTCSSLLGVINSIQSGFIQEPVTWKGESNTSGLLTLQGLVDVARIVLQQTQTQFNKELGSIGGG